MTGERTYAVLPCEDLDVALRFYHALGFVTAFIQRRPNPYAVVSLNDIHIHLAGIAGFDPAASYASVIVTVDDPGALFDGFRHGLRTEFGRTPVSGIPRLLPIRRKAGTATGFSVVDAGGNWLRFYRTGGSEADDGARAGLGRVIDVAARQGDARGDDLQALAILDAGLLRHPAAPPAERLEAILYRAELSRRAGRDPADDLARAAALIEDHGMGEGARADLARVGEAVASDPRA